MKWRDEPNRGGTSSRMTHGALLSPVPPDTNPTPLGPPCAADIVGEYQGLWRGSYPAGFRYDVAWTCGTSSTDRTILRAGVQ
jgi:hypothetical protein